MAEADPETKAEVERRRAFWCETCARDGHPLRVFVLPDVPEPRCPQHGKMVRQPNVPYGGKRA
jgi:hypothetical protein